MSDFTRTQVYYQARQIMKYFEVHSIELTCCGEGYGCATPRPEQALAILTRALEGRLTPTSYLAELNDEEDPYDD